MAASEFSGVRVGVYSSKESCGFWEGFEGRAFEEYFLGMAKLNQVVVVIEAMPKTGFRARTISAGFEVTGESIEKVCSNLAAAVSTRFGEEDERALMRSLAAEKPERKERPRGRASAE